METMNADIGDSKAIFNALHSRVENSPVYSTFYRVLYNLYLIETSQSDSGQIWYSIEKIVKEVTKAECNEDPLSLVGVTHQLSIHTLESKETQTSWGTFPNLCSEGDENALKDALNENSESVGVMTEQTPAPPPPPPPPPPLMSPCVPVTPLVPPIPTPEPKCKLKHIMWTKISNVPSEKKNIWRDILEMPDKIEVDYADLENSFANNENENASPRTDCKSKVSPLSQTRKLNVEFFLKNCGRPIKDIIQLLQYGDYEKFEVEKLKRLKEVLPQRDEIEFFQQFEGNAENLEDAEKFLYYMTQLPNHESRTEALILKADFNAQLKAISTQSEFFLKTCDLICEDQSLKIFLRYVLHTGNFLNKGSTFENARGIRISSLKSLMNTKSSTNIPKMTLLHYLVETSEQRNQGALEFVKILQEPLENASRFPMNGVTDEFNQLRGMVKRLKQKCEQTDDEVKIQFTDFLEKADAQVDETGDITEKMHEQSTRLAQYFCENEKNFNPDEFLDAFKHFCENIRTCQLDIQHRRAKEDMARRRSGPCYVSHLTDELYESCVEVNIASEIGISAQVQVDRCAECKEPSVCTCSICNAKMCRKHINSHMDKVHMLSENDSHNTKCSLHVRNTLKSFCRSCFVPLCDECVTDGGHVAHERSELEAVLEFLKGAISNENTELINCIEPFYQKVLDTTEEKLKEVPLIYEKEKKI